MMHACDLFVHSSSVTCAPHTMHPHTMCCVTGLLLILATWAM